MTAPATIASQGSKMTSVAMRHLRRNTWVVGLLVFLVILLLFTKFILPSFGPTAFANLALAALPFALVTAGQAIAVLTGGIDLSIASMMAVAGVVAARLMDGSSDGFVIVAVLVVIGVGLLMGAINGALIVYTRVPDIIVTLAMLFVWGGIALVILDRPGGSMAQWLRDVISGTMVIDWAPKALIVLIVVVAAIWIPYDARRSVSRSTRSAATGWRRCAAALTSVERRPGLRTDWTLRRARRPGGRDGHGPGRSTARAVLARQCGGGRARGCQPRRRPRDLGRTYRRRVHPATTTRRPDLHVGRFELRHGGRGGDAGGRRDVGCSTWRDVGNAHDRGNEHSQDGRPQWFDLGFWRRIMRGYPLIPLLILLATLLIVLQLLRPEIITATWLANTLKFASSAGHPGRVPDADDAHGWHRPVGRRRGNDDVVVVDTQAPTQGAFVAIAIALGAAALAA